MPARAQQAFGDAIIRGRFFFVFLSWKSKEVEGSIGVKRTDEKWTVVARDAFSSFQYGFLILNSDPVHDSRKFVISWFFPARNPGDS
jgi:hypothetical protein